MGRKQTISSGVYPFVVEALQEGKETVVQIDGRSMLPTLDKHHAITIAPIRGEIKRGDIVFLKSEDRYMVHRVKQVGEDSIITQGDNRVTTERARREDVYGVVTKVRMEDGQTVGVKSRRWKRRDMRGVIYRDIHTLLIKIFGERGRKKYRWWYLIAVLVLMWAPLGGLGIALDRYIFGLRADHLLHGSVLIPLPLCFYDICHRKIVPMWMLAVVVGAAIEGVQYLLPYRAFDVNDMVANALGVSVGTLLLCLFRKYATKEQRKKSIE